MAPTPAERIEQFGKCYTIDDVVRLRARDEEQTPILGMPRGKDDPADYEYFTGAELDRMVDEACRALVAKGLVVNSKKTVTLYAVSDLSYVVTFFALFRLGCKVLTMSARLGPPACLHLLKTAESDIVLHSSNARIDSTLAEVVVERPGIQLLPMLTRDEFDKPDAPPQPPFVREIADPDAEHVEVCLMAHSSGSTGLPKPLLLSHRSLQNSLLSGTGLRAFNALPWYHVHGLITSLQAMWMRCPAHLFNPMLPLTAANLVAALRVIKPEVCHCVPYALSLIAEDQAGVDVLKQCRIVTSAGAKTPDELGDRLIASGVNLGVIYGLTEVGHVGDSIYNRKPEDADSWAYVRPYPNLNEHMTFKHVEGTTYEAVFFKSHPALLMSNSDDPPGSYYAKDLFKPHPTIPNAWKYIARQDDRLTLITGEKILPLGMEGAVREHPLVKDALMFGNDRAVPGMLVFRAQAAAALTEDEFIRAIWPAIEQANSIADEFARITRDMVASIAYGVEYPVTDKSNVIRAGATRLFGKQIEAIYARLDGGGDAGAANGARNGTYFKKPTSLDVAGLEAFIMDTFRTQTEIELPSADADFFASGVDSLRAIQARRLFQESLDFGNYRLPTNVVYDARTAANLAVVFANLLNRTNDASATTGETETNGLANRNGIHSETEQTPLAVMQSLIDKYSTFDTESQHADGGESVLLTGATGALGAHILHQLLYDSNVERVTCLVRGPHGLKRVHASLRERGLDLGSSRAIARKLVVLEAPNLGDPLLGLDAFDYSGLVADTTTIIHAAWPVHFGLSASSFEPHIAGLRNLLQLSLQVPSRKPARVLFASSISTAFNIPRPDNGDTAVVAEAPLASLSDASEGLGYAASKLIGERICEAAAREGANVAVLRIGQITGDTDRGIWNDREAVPLLVRSALELKALPRLDGQQGRCEWIPVDVVAAACIEIATTMKDASATTPRRNSADGPLQSSDVKAKAQADTAKARYYNINTPHVVSWNEEVLPAFKAAGLDFESVSLDEWLAKLRARGDELGSGSDSDAIAKRLPALKLADYYERNYGGTPESANLRFSITKARRDSPSLAACPDMADSQLVGKYLKSWLAKWEAEK
ncbi:NRPS-like enzyme [Sporothrix schenckii 1099-18]|uniref:NRPS-like enzyme n=1 Tax=Sporothrix schenckii 1099-18 TaxID=1397361 RepID=A0A0F2MCY0_SPOSC|nr:NRPS-like enzyme [Sporothrix schenckii 1099-18]KJR86710.1 NRPS-like enzyme [Sporothrix schenckii 1099-18]